MGDNELVEVDPNEINREKDSGAVGTSAPTGINKQGWSGKYVNYKFQDIHRVIEDALTSSGGFLGVKDNSDTVNTSNNIRAIDGYTYNRALTTELQFVDRDNNTGAPHNFGRFIRSMVNPIYTERIMWTAISGKEKVVDPEFDEFMVNSDGRNNSYSSQQRYGAKQAVSHDVVYRVCDKVNGKFRVNTRGITLTNENYIEEDESGELNSIAFLDHYDYKDDGSIENVYQRRYYMDKGRCKTSLMVAEDNGESWKKLKYEDVPGKTKDIGINVMCADAFLVDYEPTSGYVPQNPTFKPVVYKYADYFNENNRHQWLMTKHRNPIMNFPNTGNVKGTNGSLGHMLDQRGTADGVFPPTPTYVQPKEVAVSIQDLERSKIELHELMSDSGVQVSVSNSAQSGTSKQYDYKATADALRRTVQLLKEMDKWVFEMFKLFNNKNYDYERLYPANFYIQEEVTIDEAIDFATKLEDREKYQSAELVLQSVIIEKFGGKLGDKNLDLINEEFKTVSRDDDKSDLGNPKEPNE